MKHANYFDKHSLETYVTSQGSISFSDFIQQTADKKNPAASATTSIIQHPTGYMYLDYAAGSYLTVHDPNDNDAPMFQYHNVGVAGGQFITVIAKTQGGKSSLTLALGAGIIEPYINQWRYDQAISDLCRAQGIKIPKIENYPFVEILDSEHTMSIDYARKVCRYTASMAERYIRITDIVTDRDLMRALKKHIEYKVSCMTKVPMPMVDTMNRPVYNYPPTVLIIDSLSNLLLEDAPEGTVDSKDKKADMLSIYESAIQNTAGARKAKTIGALISYLVDYAKKYNIVIFSISHIGKSLPGPNGIPTKMAFFLRPGESIVGGGERGLYLASSMLRLDFFKGIGTEKATQLNLGDGITGREVIAQYVKCKTNSKNNPVKLAYTNLSGYDPLLSCLIHDKDNETLTKTGNFYCLRECPDYKFTMKNYAEVFGDHPEMFTAYYDEMKERASKMLDNPEAVEERNAKFMKGARKDIHDAYGDGDRSTRDNMMDLDDLLSLSNN